MFRSSNLFAHLIQHAVKYFCELGDGVGDGRGRYYYKYTVEQILNKALLLLLL